MRVIVCGSRDEKDGQWVWLELSRLDADLGFTTVVHGDYRGVDRLAKTWARARSIKQEPHPADWDGLGTAAGPTRNKEMADLGADACIVFPGGPGTRGMRKLAEKAGIKIIDVARP